MLDIYYSSRYAWSVQTKVMSAKYIMLISKSMKHRGMGEPLTALSAFNCYSYTHLEAKMHFFAI